MLPRAVQEGVGSLQLGSARPWRARVAVLCAVVLVLAIPATEVGADPDLDELRQQRQEAEQRHSDRVDQLRASERQLEELQAEFSLAVEEYNEAQERLREIKARLAELEAEVDALTEVVTGRQDRVGRLVRGLYQQGGGITTYSAVLGSAEFDETSKGLEYLRSAQRGQLVMIETYLADQTTLDGQREALDDVRAEQAELAQELDEHRAALEEQVDEQGAEIASLEGDVQSAQDELASAEEAEHAERQRRAQEEEDRRQAARSDRAERDDSEEEAAVATSVSAPSEAAAVAVQAALGQVGTPYRWGGNSPSTGFDCSGLTSWAYAQAGVSIPRTSRAQYANLPKVSRDELQPGDLLFFNSPISHVGMYIGNGQMVEAPYSGMTVRTRSINRGGYVGATRPTG